MQDDTQKSTPEKGYTAIDLLKMEPFELLNFVQSRFSFDIPEEIDSIESMQYVNEVIAKTANGYAFLMGMANAADIYKKALPADTPKKVKEEAILRQNIFKSYAESVKLTGKAVSRMFSVKQQIDEELKMTDGYMSRGKSSNYR